MANAVVTRDVAVSPQVGDLRVTFTVVEPHDISLCFKQRGDTFVPWTSSNGRAIELQEDGLVDAAAMFASCALRREPVDFKQSNNTK